MINQLRMVAAYFIMALLILVLPRNRRGEAYADALMEATRNDREDRIV